MRDSNQAHPFILPNPPRSPQADWARQQRSAAAIGTRFAQGKDTVLLADEVGMGKTYVALAVMADYLFASQENDRKVLLVTPPSTILRVKWQQEIQSFNDNYLTEIAREQKGMRPVVINNYWDLLRNLKDYDNENVERVTDVDNRCFTWCMFNWAFTRGLLGKKRRILWLYVENLHEHHPQVVNFKSYYSEQAIWRFLDREYGGNQSEYQALFRSLHDRKFDVNSRFGRAHIALLFKRFGSAQDKYEPNIYIIGMNALSRPYSNEENNQFLAKYLLALLLFGRHTETRGKHAKALVDANVLRGPYVNEGNQYLKGMEEIAGGKFYGLREAAHEVVNKVTRKEDGDTRWQTISESIMRGEPASGANEFFKDLGDQVLLHQMARANMGLAVIDEVHNWKGGAYGAKYFEKFYAPTIANKLIMSATPFQMEEGEMRRIFQFVQKKGGGSQSVIDGLASEDGEINRCVAASNSFCQAWRVLSKLPAQTMRLQQIFDGVKGDSLAATAASVAQDPAESEEIRQFCLELAAYRAAILALQQGLGQIVIRHTKSRAKRDFRIGEDFHATHSKQPRNTLYPSTGYANPEDALVNFIGMRLGQLVQREQNKSFEANARLLSGMTSSTAAFRASSSQLGKVSPATLAYQKMFDGILDKGQHPKVAATVARAYHNFKEGRKTLIFCERVATLTEIEEALSKRIGNFIGIQGTETSNERRNLFKRWHFLDNLWWHSLWDALDQRETGDALLERYLPAAQARVQRCLAKADAKPSARRIIKLLDISLIANAVKDGQIALPELAPALDFFVHMDSLLDSESLEADLLENLLDLKARKRDINDEDNGPIDALEAQEEEDIAESLEAAIETVIQRQYRQRDNLWLTQKETDFHFPLWQLLASEATLLRKLQGTQQDTEHHKQLALVFFDVQADLMAGIRKATLRDDLLIRYKRHRPAAATQEYIAEGLRTMQIGHDASMLVRATRFLHSLVQADGSISRADLTHSRRKSLWHGVFVGKVGSVATLSGITRADSRAGLCAAFNSPMLPDILICTSIGSEGIDLHRQCADVIHHDLPWNPAKLEQRNGRVDRVGSLAAMSDDLFIHIGIPFLAHNYEQHQYRTVYSRAQKFEVLLGKPEFDTDDIEEEDFSDENGETTREVKHELKVEDEVLQPLPQVIVEALRLDLTVGDNDAANC